MSSFIAYRKTILVMLSLFFCGLGAGAAENKKLVLNFEQRKLSADIKHTPLKEVLVEIKQERNIWINTDFIQDRSLLDDNISIELQNVSIKEGLERILTGINHSLVFTGNKIVGVMLFGKPEQRTYYGRTPYQRNQPAQPRITRQRP